VTFPAYPEVLPLACTATKRPKGDIRMAVAMQKLESAESDRMRAGDPEVANSPDSAAQNVIPMYELKWSHAEKTVARRAFDLALGKELAALLQEAKGRAARIEEPSELWDLESWLTERRREIDRRYDYRYSILPLVFAQLLRDGRLTEDDLHGLGQEKLDLIRRASAI
jgi:Photoprotection regulator fluorescence recovery protein